MRRLKKNKVNREGKRKDQKHVLGLMLVFLRCSVALLILLIVNIQGKIETRKLMRTIPPTVRLAPAFVLSSYDLGVS